jgi:hypothetical protein
MSKLGSFLRLQGAFRYLPGFDAILGRGTALFEAARLIAGLDDVAMMGQPVQRSE